MLDSVDLRRLVIRAYGTKIAASHQHRPWDKVDDAVSLELQTCPGENVIQGVLHTGRYASAA